MIKWVFSEELYRSRSRAVKILRDLHNSSGLLYDRKDQYPDPGVLFIENYSYFKTSVDHLSVPGSLADIHFFK